MYNNEFSEETKQTLTLLQNLAKAVFHEVNNLLLPIGLTLPKIEMYLESNKIEQLKKELPQMIESTDKSLMAINEILKILYNTINGSKNDVEYWQNVDIKNIIKENISKILSSNNNQANN